MKKLLSLALVLAMVFTSFTFVYAADLISGLSGDGTQSNPVKITSCADWETFATALNANSALLAGYYYELTADLDFADYTWTAGKTVTVAGTFTSHFNGGQHVIKNFHIDSANGVYAMFGECTSATVIENLGLVDVLMTPHTGTNPAQEWTAILVRTGKGGIIRNCFINGVKKTVSYSWQKAWAGFVGHTWWATGAVPMTIENSYFLSKAGQEGYIELSDMSGPNRQYFAPFVAYIDDRANSKMTITNCYSDVDCINSEAPANFTPVVTNSYYNVDNNTGRSRVDYTPGTAKTTAEMKNLASTLGAAFAVDSKYANDGYPVLAWQKFDGVVSKNADLASVSFSKGEISPKFASNVTDYTIYVENNVEKITIGATAVDAGSTITGTVTDKALTVGDNLVTITVTAEDTTVTKKYNFVVKRLSAGEDIPVLLPEGAPEDAILINSLAELQALADASTEGKYYVLTTDIDLEDANWSTFIGTAAKPFKGTFHGNSHVIKNAKIVNTGASDMGYGIFGYVDGDALITHLGVDNIQHLFTASTGIYYSHSAFGGIVAFLQGNAKIENCFAKNVLIDTKIPNSSAWSGFYGDQVSYAGGVVGTTVGGNVEIVNCYSLNFQEIDDSASVQGGVVGSAGEGSFKAITNCYSNFMLTSCATADKGKVVNCYTTDTSGWSANGAKPGILVTEAELKNKAPELGAAYIADIQGLNNGFPMLSWEMNLTRLEGNGSEESPFIISDVDTLAQVAGHRDTKGKFYKLTADIDMGGVKLASFIGKVGAPFEGTFDGNGKVIKNFVIAPKETGVWTELGIFACVGGNAVIKNVGIENVTVSPEGEWGFNATVGGLISIMEGNSKVTDCYVKNMTFKNDNDALYNAHNGGGLVGLIVSDGVVVENCYALNVTEERNSVAMFNSLIGLAKEFSAIRNCYTDGSVSMTYRRNIGKISNSYRLTDENGAGYSRIGIITKEAVLKTKASDLGASFAADDTLINGGYPVLAWQVQ